MAKATKKNTNVKKNTTACGSAFNIGKPVVYMVAAILTCLCLTLGGFMVGFQVGARQATPPEPNAPETTNE